MGKGNIYNDIQKGLYDLAILEIGLIKKQTTGLDDKCDQLILFLESYNNGIKPKKKDYKPLLENILKNK